jgi:hypothetical protein
MNMVVIQKPSIFVVSGFRALSTKQVAPDEKYGIRIINIHKHYTSNTKLTQSWGQCKSEVQQI